MTEQPRPRGGTLLPMRRIWWLLSVAACSPAPVPLGGGRPPPDPVVPEGERPLCAAEPTAPGPVIAQDLQSWSTRLRESNNRYFGELAWRDLEALGEELETTAAEPVDIRILRGWFRLKFGLLDEAIADLDAAEALAVSAGDGPRTERARQLLGATWLRKAETVNCLDNASGESCIVPFGEGAIHVDPALMAEAASAFERALADNGDQPSLQWLDNITYMARGTWPQDVPAEWTLPDGFLVSEEDLPEWPNVMPKIGVTEPTLSGGASIEDFDGDGRMDVLVSTLDPWSGMDLYLNRGDGGFCHASDASGVSSISGLLSFTIVDYDNDGDVDVFGPRAAWMGAEGTVRPSLLRNDGAGRFEDVAVAAGFDVPSVNGPTQVATWGDVNLDGWLDVFVGRESEVNDPRVSSLFMAQGDGTFVDVAPEVGLDEVGFVKGAAFVDVDRDADLDLAVSLFGSPNKLFMNDGGQFVDRALLLGVRMPERSFPVSPIDYDQDGWQDLFFASFTNNYAGGGPLDPTYFRSVEPWVLDRMGLPPAPDTPSENGHLYHNTGAGFADVTALVGLDDVHATMGLQSGDIDADGYPDLILGTGAPEYDALEPNVVYHNVGGERFTDVTPAVGMGSIQKGHGVSFGDLDDDGDDDVLAELGGAFTGDIAPNQLFVNPTNDPTTRARHTVTLKLEGVSASRSAMHARVRVVTPTLERWQVVGETGSYGNSTLQLEFGLADADTIERVEIDWPGGALEVVEEVPIDSFVRIRQGEGVVEARPYAPIAIDGVPTP